MYISTAYEPNVAELTRGLKLARRPTRTVLWILCALCFVIGLLNLALRSYGVGAMGCVLGIFYAYLLVVGQKQTVSRQANTLCRPTKVTITDDVYISETDVTKSEFKWPAFVKLVDIPEFFVLFVTKRNVVVLPKRVLDAAQVAELSAFLAAHGPSRQLSRSGADGR